MVELWCSVVFVGMVVGGRGASWCCQPVGRRSSFDACMPGQFGVGRLACGLFMVTSCPLQWFSLVCGRVGRLMVGLFGVVSLALQRALEQSDYVRIGALLVPLLVGASCVGPAWYVLIVRRPPTVEEKSNDRWFDRCKSL